MSKPPAFQFDVAEFLTDENVALMSLAGRGAYVTLLCYCWREGSIPADMNRMGRLCGIDGSAMAQLWEELCLCFSKVDERYVNPWIERSRLRQIERGKERQASGRKGAESRWEKAQAAKSVPVEGLTLDSSADSLANSSAIATDTQEPSGSHSADTVVSPQTPLLDININNINTCAEGDRGGVGEKGETKPRKRKVRKPTACDEDFLAELQASPAYAHLNVKALHGRMVAWCEARGKQPTRLRFLGWLNREDPPPAQASAITPSDEWAGRSIAATIEDLPAPYRRVALDASTDEQRANVLANYNRLVCQARGTEATA